VTGDDDPAIPGESSDETGAGDETGVPEPTRSPARIREVYDEIATHFSKTRVSPWPEVEAFLGGRTGELGADVGCGNGRHAEVLAGRVECVVGIDVSRAVLAEARGRMDAGGWDAELLQADAAGLPLRTRTVDLAVYVATLHHLPDREARIASLDELARVLAAGGRALVSAWSTTHETFDADPGASEGFDTTVDWTLPGGETVPRFYHIYTPAEFQRDIVESELLVEKVYVSSGNCYAEVGSQR